MAEGGEIRTKSATGGEKGVKPERHDLIPRKGTAAIARVFGFGASKYADHNWRRGYEWSKSLSAMQRHIDAFVDGDTYDEESGLPHLAHAGFHVLVLLTWLEEQGEGADNPYDDRWPHGMERARRKLAKKAAKRKARKAARRARREEVHASQRAKAEKLLQLRADLVAGKVEPEELAEGPWHVGFIPRVLVGEVDPHTDWGPMLDDRMWIIPESEGPEFLDLSQPMTIEFTATDVATETMRLMLGLTDQEVVELTTARFIAGPYGTEDTDDSMSQSFVNEALNRRD